MSAVLFGANLEFRDRHDGAPVVPTDANPSCEAFGMPEDR
jgi:hypothetical protein